MSAPRSHENPMTNDSDTIKQEHDSDDEDCVIMPEVSYGLPSFMRAQT